MGDGLVDAMKYAMQQAGGKPYHAAQRLGLNPNTVARVLGGKPSPQAERALRAAGYLPGRRKRFAAWLDTRSEAEARAIREGFDDVANEAGLTRGELVRAIGRGDCMVVWGGRF